MIAETIKSSIEAAVAAGSEAREVQSLREPLAIFLHEHHPRTEAGAELKQLELSRPYPALLTPRKIANACIPMRLDEQPPGGRRCVEESERGNDYAKQTRHLSHERSRICDGVRLSTVAVILLTRRLVHSGRVAPASMVSTLSK